MFAASCRRLNVNVWAVGCGGYVTGKMTRKKSKSPSRVSAHVRAAINSRSPSVSHDDALTHELRDDPAFAMEYLKAALAENEDPQVLLVALRQVATAHGMAKVAERAKIERESVYRALSAKGNPRFSTIVSILRAIGLSLSVAEARESARSASARVTRVRKKSAKKRLTKSARGTPKTSTTSAASKANAKSGGGSSRVRAA
jgi:probable addiction module antidote protein